MFSGENVSYTRLLFRYTRAFSKKDKLKALIVTNITYLTTFIDNKDNSAVYTWVNIHGLYHPIEMIGSQTTLTI